MEPLSVASAFASIVGLLHLYKSERKARLSEQDEQKADDIQHFLEWLRRHDHESLVTLIQGNTEMFRSLEATLAERHDVIAEQLASLDVVITAIAEKLDLLGPFARAIRTEAQLSDQAVGILRSLNQSEASKFLEIRTRGGIHLGMMDGNDGDIPITELRFLDDDLQTLVHLGLLGVRHNSKGDRIFTITRRRVAR